MRNKSVLNSPRLQEIKKKKHQALRKKMLFIFIISILVLVGLSFISKWEKLNINNIQVSGNKVIENKMVEDVVQKEISGNYLYFLPKTNFLLYPKNKIEIELKNKFKRIKNIAINNKNIKTLDISLIERTGLYTYCGISLAQDVEILNNDTTHEKCYFIDEDGYIFDEAPYFSGEIYLKFYGKTQQTENNLEESPTNSYFFQPIFKKLISFKEALEKINIKPAIFYVEDNGDISVFLSSSLKSELGPKIILKTDSDFEKIIENLQSVLTTEPFQTDFRDKYSSLLYIDLRFGNKVYYKFK